MSAAMSGHLRHWSRLGSWAVVDQALFATGNFILGILLARWMSPTRFGAFTIAQSAILLFGAFHMALVTEPLLVFGPSRFADRFSSYLLRLVHGHWLITGAGAALFLLSALVLRAAGAVELSGAMLGAAVATPPVLLTWLSRRASFACFRPQWAALAGAGYLFLMLLGIGLLYFFQRLTPLAAFLVLAVSSFIAGSSLIRRLLQSIPAGPEVPRHELLAGHWSYGRWAVASSSLSWASANLYFFALPIFGGLADVGALRALLNLVLPMHQLIVALSVLLLPLLVHARGASSYRPTIQLALLVLVGAALFYGAILAAAARPVITAVYGGNYASYAPLLRAAAALPVIAAMVAVGSNALRAEERPDLVFRAYAATAIVTTTVGLWCVSRWQVAGAIAGELLAGMTTALVMAVLIGRHAPAGSGCVAIRAEHVPLANASR